MNDGYTYRERIRLQAAGQRLDQYLSVTYTHSSLTEWREHITDGRVLLDGARANIETVLSSGQQLHWHRPPWTEPDAPLTAPVLYEDAGVLVVAKPAGLPTMPGGGFLQHTLLHQLRLLDPSVSPMHRLGRWTSGAVVCARDPSAGASIAAQFAQRTIDKRYRADASGRPAQDQFAIEVAIGPVPYARMGKVHAARANGRHASSTVTVVERREDAFLCDVAIATGRPHQIRIHLAAAGHPLVGDPLYVRGGLPAPDGTALPGDPGYDLHAAEIGFDCPRTGQRVRVSAPMPTALRRRA